MCTWTDAGYGEKDMSNGEGLCFTAVEERRPVGAGQKANVRADHADFRHRLWPCADLITASCCAGLVQG
jgi:hypothetical protein